MSTVERHLVVGWRLLSGHSHAGRLKIIHLKGTDLDPSGALLVPREKSRTG